nr:hypothetical protein [Rhizobium leguminosarum]
MLLAEVEIPAWTHDRKLWRSSYKGLREAQNHARVDGDKPAKEKFKAYPIGYFHIDIAQDRRRQAQSRLARLS